MRKLYTTEKYQFDTLEEVIDAVNNHEIVKASVIIDDEAMGEFDIIPDDSKVPEGEKVTDASQLVICYNYAEPVEKVDLDSIFMLKYL